MQSLLHSLQVQDTRIVEVAELILCHRLLTECRFDEAIARHTTQKEKVRTKEVATARTW